jgi:hypothetical protein
MLHHQLPPNLLDGQTDINDMMLLFAADIIDHDIITRWKRYISWDGDDSSYNPRYTTQLHCFEEKDIGIKHRK